MADDAKLPNLGGNGFIWILLVAASTYFVAHQIPLQGSRPATADRSIRERIGEQHVDARLWQDPFAAVAETLAKSPELKPENCKHTDGQYDHVKLYCRPPSEASSSKGALALIVSVSAAPYSEDQEARRRLRYAVLAGLAAEGFFPEDPQHIGFYWPSPAAPSQAYQSADIWSQPPQLATAAQPDEVPTPVAASPNVDERSVGWWHAALLGLAAPSHDVQAPAAGSRDNQPRAIPFEWFRSNREVSKSKDDPKRVLLLWIDEDALGPDALPVKQLAKLVCPPLPAPARGTSAAWSKVKIIGPRSSTTLKDMVEEVAKYPSVQDPTKNVWSRGICPDEIPAQFYISDATVSDATLLPKNESGLCQAQDDCLGGFFQRHGVSLYRLIATDEALAGAIGHELELRGVHKQGGNRLFALIANSYARSMSFVRALAAEPGQAGGDKTPGQARYSHIALVSEWDTLYGRELPDTLKRCLGQQPKCAEGKTEKEWLHSFKYLRGLDGQMPNADGLGSNNGSKDTDNKQNKDSKDNAKSRPDPSAKDRAEGQSQFDYLRRLGDRIQQLDAKLRRDNENGIEAVGVLGSDVYDKLLVLQVLRPLLPNAWFFTTDLDALFLHPSAQTLTRNLLVASSFGLQLNADIQGEIPPFRSSYQTAEFLATRVAIHGDTPPNKRWSQQPLLFEIGSAGAFQFAPQAKIPGPPATDGKGSSKSEVERCNKELVDCMNIHGPESDMVPQPSTYSALGLLVLGLSLVLALGLYVALTFRALRRRMRTGVDAFMGGSTGYRSLIVVGLAVAIFLLGAGLHAFLPPLTSRLTQEGQPMTLLEGISVWPTIFLRAATLLLCIYLIFRSWERLAENRNKIVEDLQLTETPQHMSGAIAGAGRGDPLWLGFASPFWYRPPAGDGARPSSQTACRYWDMYVRQGRLRARIGRVVAGIVAMFLLWWMLFLVFGQQNPPTRGTLSLDAYEWITFILTFATLFLVFFVADTTLLCWRLIKTLREKTVVWGPGAVRKYSDRLGFDGGYGHRLRHEHCCLEDDWIDLLFISKRTKCITNLLYYPFLIIALILVSRSRLFANYIPNVPDLVTMGLGVVIVIACAVALRWSAEASRDKARRKLIDEIAAARSLPDGGPLASQLELLLRRVEELHEGAFSPFSQQPVVRAMLLPLGSIGGTALLEYLMLPGFA